MTIALWMGMELSQGVRDLISWAVIVSGVVVLVWATVSWVKFFIKLAKKDQNQNPPDSN